LKAGIKIVNFFKVKFCFIANLEKNDFQ